MLNDKIFNESQTLLEFFSSISGKFNFTLPTAMIGRIVASTIFSKPAMLQICLGWQHKAGMSLNIFMIMMYVPCIKIFNSDNLFLKVMKLLIIMEITL